MQISEQVVEQVKAQIRDAEQAYQDLLQRDIDQQDAIFERIKARIPGRIAAAVAAKDDSAVVCDIYEHAPATKCDLFNRDSSRDRLFFVPRPTFLWRLGDGNAPHKDWLIGAAKLVYDHCVEIGLQPKIPHCVYETISSTSEGKTGHWAACKLMIHWNPEQLHNLLGVS